MLFAANARQPLFGLGKLIAKIGSSADRFENGGAMQLLLVLQQCQIDGGVRRFLLAEVVLLLRRGKVRRRGVEYLLVAVAFFLQRQKPALSLRQFRFGGRRAHDQLRAAFFVSADARLSAIAFDRDLIEVVAILPRLGLDRVTALGALGVLGLRLLHTFRLLVNFLAQLMDL